MNNRLSYNLLLKLNLMIISSDVPTYILYQCQNINRKKRHENFVILYHVQIFPTNQMYIFTLWISFQLFLSLLSHQILWLSSIFLLKCHIPLSSGISFLTPPWLYGNCKPRCPFLKSEGLFFYFSVINTRSLRNQKSFCGETDISLPFEFGKAHHFSFVHFILTKIKFTKNIILPLPLTLTSLFPPSLFFNSNNLSRLAISFWFWRLHYTDQGVH